MTLRRSKKTSLTLVVFAVSILTFAGVAQAAKSKWMKPSEGNQFVSSIISNKSTLTKLECKDSGKLKAKNLGEAIVIRFTYTPNTGGTVLQWGVNSGSKYGKTSKTISGFTFSCGIR